ncbi:MAG: hypothetical protein ABT20_11635 [Rubrivivax sp. SCN 70-15]|nr:MAG: hypothetical protein ABT20_11635 [Rubrivivax sp. SCN 70-15]
MSGAITEAGDLGTPGLLRRLACMLYEGVLLFGVLMATGLVYSVATQERNALQGLHGLQFVVFVVLGIYFVGFWSSRRGQTLAMQTWHIRLVTRDGSRVSRSRALARYLLAWVWFLPALASVYSSGIRGPGVTFATLGVGMLVYAASSRLHPDRQFWHDAACGTRLVTWRPRLPAG